MEIFVKEILHSFGYDNSKRRMSYSRIGVGLVTGMLYILVRILVTGILFTFGITIITVVLE